MQDQIAELAARLNSASTADEARSVDLAIYHVRNDREQQYRLVVNMLLAHIATLEALYDADYEKLRKLESEADEKIESFNKEVA